MKIVNRKTFLFMPENTVFTKYKPCCFGNLMIKGESWKNDFLYQQIADAIDSTGSSDFFDKLDDAEKKKIELKMDFDSQERDGCFDEDQLFAVWKKEDVLALIERLKMCVKTEG